MNKQTIKVENLSKKYRIGLKEELHDSLAGYLTDLITSPFKNFARIRKLSKFQDNNNERDVIWALKDVSFEVNQGEVLGIIGKNGAGKSTLLKILSRITKPTTGRATIDGRVASLLEVGTGFHQELTGRENIYLNGTILGMKKLEIDKKLDVIIDFSGVEKFIDTPVKRYSSGMNVRLAFAVAAHLDPEILIIDEVLAVGDTLFQQKCIDKMTDISKSGRTILFVSHNLTAVKALCNKAIVLDDGIKIFEGEVDDAINHYLTGPKLTGREIDLSAVKRNKGEREIVFENISLENDHIPYGEDIDVKIKLKTTGATKVFEGLCLAINILDRDNNPIYHVSNQFLNKPFVHKNDEQVYRFTIANNLKPSTYKMTLFLTSNNPLQHNAVQDWLQEVVEIVVTDGNPYNCKNTRFIQGCVFPKFEIVQE